MSAFQINCMEMHFIFLFMARREEDIMHRPILYSMCLQEGTRSNYILKCSQWTVPTLALIMQKYIIMPQMVPNLELIILL